MDAIDNIEQRYTGRITIEQWNDGSEREIIEKIKGDKLDQKFTLASTQNFMTFNPEPATQYRVHMLCCLGID